MILRTELFGNPLKAAANMSPDGRWLSWAAAGGAGKPLNVWVAPAEDMSDARQVTFDQRRGVSGHSWAQDSQHVLFTQDKDGDENHQLFAVDAATGEQRCLTPYPGTRASLVSVSRERRGELLISLNKRDRRFADLYVLNLSTAELTLAAENPGFLGFVVDQNFVVRFANRTTLNGGLELLRPDGNEWSVWESFGPEDARSSGISHLDQTGRYAYLLDSRGRDTAALVEVDLQEGTRRVIAENSQADIGRILADRQTRRPLAYVVNYERPVMHVVDPVVQDDVDFLNSHGLGHWWPSTRTEDDRKWLISASSDQLPGSAYLYDRAAKSLTKLLDVRPELMTKRLARMQSATVKSRDGLSLVCYVSLPTELDTGEPLRSREPAPTVVYVHGGPWARDNFGFSSVNQWLCSRGYAVLNVNFRSSTGFGKAFLNAGNGEWGRRMDDDIEDAVEWAIQMGLADPKRLAIAGMSYGGFAVLSALTRHPGRYTCGVDIVGPTNLESLMRATPPQWAAGRQMLFRAVGNPETAEGQELLRARSPLHRADQIRVPLLIAQGANDPRVPQSESDQMVQAMLEREIPVSYALFPDEGHGFSREPNRLVFNAVMEAFLSRHLGGRLEPFSTRDFPGNTLQMLHGNDGLVPDYPTGR